MKAMAIMEHDERVLFYVDEELVDAADLLDDCLWHFTESNTTKLKKRGYDSVGAAFKAFCSAQMKKTRA